VGLKEEAVFDKDYKTYDPKTKTFVYDEVEVKTKEVQVEEYVDTIISVEPNTPTPFRVEFDVPPNSQGKFDIELTFYVHGEEVTEILDPWYQTDYFLYRRQITDLQVMQPINSSGTYAASDIDNNGTDEWIYGDNCSAGSMQIYYNDSTNFAIIANDSTECYWFSTTPLDMGSSVVPDNLVFYMPFDNVETEAIDFVNELNATLHNTPTQEATGKVNNAYFWNSTNSEYGEITDSAGLLQFEAGTQDFSICAWAKQLDYTDGNNNFIIDYRDGWHDGWSFQYTKESGDYYHLQLDARDVYCAAISDNDWHHICMVVDRDGNGQCYMDGAASGSPVGMGSEVMAITTTTPNLARHRYETNRWFDGYMDELRIYNKTLTLAEIKEIMDMNATLGSQQQQPIVITVNSVQNQNIYKTTHVVNVTTDSHSNCTLYWNGTVLADDEYEVLEHTWTRTNLSGNYSTINVSCTSNLSYTLPATTDNWWIAMSETFCTNPLTLSSETACRQETGVQLDIDAQGAYKLKLTVRTDDESEDMKFNVTPSGSQTLNITISDTNLAEGHNITLNLTRSGDISELVLKLPIENSQDCSYDTNQENTFKVTDYANCYFEIEDVKSNELIYYLWYSHKWDWNNIPYLVQKSIEAGEPYYILHSKTKETS
jgi:hypothetical protein